MCVFRDNSDAAAPDRGSSWPGGDRSLMTVEGTAAFLQVSESWVYRHLSELPIIGKGRIIRIDCDLLRRTIENGKSLRPEGAYTTMQVKQRFGRHWYSGRIGYGMKRRFRRAF